MKCTCPNRLEPVPGGAVIVKYALDIQCPAHGQPDFSRPPSEGLLISHNGVSSPQVQKTDRNQSLQPEGEPCATTRVSLSALLETRNIAGERFDSDEDV